MDITSGTLTVKAGGVTATLTLTGSYVTSNFALSDDGAGGAFVVDSPVAAVGPLFQAMATVGAAWTAMAQDPALATLHASAYSPVTLPCVHQLKIAIS